MNIVTQNNNKEPLILFVANPTVPDSFTYDNGEGYDHETEMIEFGTYFRGSAKKNTRCNKFTVFGADKKHDKHKRDKEIIFKYERDYI